MSFSEEEEDFRFVEVDFRIRVRTKENSISLKELQEMFKDIGELVAVRKIETVSWGQPF